MAQGTRQIRFGSISYFGFWEAFRFPGEKELTLRNLELFATKVMPEFR